VATGLRQTGISVVGDMPWGTHFCSFYETKQDLLEILIPYFETGLGNNEFCLWIVSNSELLTVHEARSALQAVVPDLDRYIVDRSIEIVGHDDWFLDGGSFDFHRVANRFKEKIDEALRRGYVGMRVNGSPAWILTRDPNELREFEAEVNQLFSNERIIASCTYPLPDSRAEFLLDVARNHQFAIARRDGIWDIVETPELIQAKAEIERLNAKLEQRVIERTKKLEATTERLRAEIKDRKEVEEALRQSEERFAAFMDNLPGYAWMKDLQGRYVYVNEMVRGLPGYRSLGKTDGQIWPADLAAEYRANDQQVIAAKKPLHTLEHYQNEGKQRYMAGSKFPIFDKTGGVALVGGVGVDITERIEAEEAARRSEDHIRVVIDTIPALVFSAKPDGSLDFINQRHREFTGLSLNDVSGWRWIDVIHPDDRAQLVDRWKRSLATGEPLLSEARLRRANGDYRWLLIRAIPLRDESGKIVEWYGTKNDITERKVAEEEARESQQLVRLVLETLPVGVAVVNRAGDIELVNAASKYIWGGTIAGGRERWGQTKGHWHDSGRRIAPGEWASVRALSKGEISLNELIDIEAYDGKRKTIRNSAAPIRNAEGLIVGAVIVNEDVTDRVRAEEALRRSEDHLRLVIETIPVMAWTVRPDGVVDFLNQRWLDYAGLSLEQYVEDPMGPIHPDDIPRVMEKWRAQMAIGGGYENEMRLRRADGEYRWFLVRTEPLRDAQGNVVKWYGTSTDITDRKRAEEQLKITSAQLRALSARLSSAREEEGTRIARELHDQLGAALTSLKWDLEGVSKQCSERVSQTDYAILHDRLEEMMSLVDDILGNVRRISSELRPSILDDLGLIATIEWQARQFESRSGIICKVDMLIDDLQLSREQSTGVFRILQEALTNILRHAHATKVNILVDVDDGELVLEVRDNGRGITDAQNTGSRSLGLIGMRERAHLLGGRIEISGTAGNGTLLILRVPVHVPISN